MDLTAFKTYVKRDFKRTDKDTELVQAWNDMVLWIAVRMPHGNYKFQSYIQTVVRQEDYALPSNIIHLIHPLRLLIGSAASDPGYQLSHLTKEEYDNLYPNPNRTNPQTARPQVYTVFSRSILLGPIPDLSTYLVEMNWSKRPTTLSGASDTPDLGAEWDEVFKQGVLDRLYAGLGLIEEAQYWASLYRDAEHNPVGLAKQLFDVERDREGSVVGQVQANWL